MRTGFMTKFQYEENQKAVGAQDEWHGWLWWVEQHERRFEEMKNAGMNIKEVWPERMLNGDFEQMKEVIDWLGLQWNPEVKDFIDEKLWKKK